MHEPIVLYINLYTYSYSLLLNYTSVYLLKSNLD